MCDFIKFDKKQESYEFSPHRAWTLIMQIETIVLDRSPRHIEMIFFRQNQHTPLYFKYTDHGNPTIDSTEIKFFNWPKVPKS